MADLTKLKTRDDFSGSFTDNPYSNDPKLCSYADNLLVTLDQKLELRPGSAYTFVAHTKPLSEVSRGARMFKFRDESYLFGVTGKNLWNISTASTDFTDVGDIVAAAVVSSDLKVSYDEWKNHIFVATDSPNSPVVKVYNDGSWRVRTAGLPKPAQEYSPSSATQITNAITLVNVIRTKMIAHFADTALHPVADTVSGASIGSAATNEATLYSLTGQLLNAYQKHFNDARSSTAYHTRDFAEADYLTGGIIGGVGSLADMPPTATTLQSTLTSTETPDNITDANTRLNDLRLKFNVHDGVNDSHNAALTTGANAVTSALISASSHGPLIELDYSKIYSLVNQLKSKMNAHMALGASADYGHTNADGTNTIVVADATTPETLESLIYSMSFKYTAHDVDAQLGAGWAFHKADEGAGYPLSRSHTPTYTAPPYPDYVGGTRAGDWAGCLAKIIDIKNAFNDHAGHRVAHHGSSSTAYNPYLLTWDDFTLATYDYAFVYHYAYSIGTEDFEDFSTPLFIEAADVIPTTVQGLAISNIPTLANTSDQQYDTAAITVRIYRTTNGGTTYYQVGEVANGTTTFTDVVTDTELVNREQLYTTGGVVDNDSPPIAKFIHIVNNKAYYGGITDLSGNVLPRRVQESIANDPDSCPATFYDDLDDDIAGISSAKSVPLVFGKHSFYRLEGGFDELGRGSLSHTIVADSVGLVSENSLVKTDQGVFFAGTDGFYYTDGYTYIKLSKDWDETYQSITSTEAKAKRITGAYDALNRRVWWGVQRSSSATDNDCCVILDLTFPFQPTPTWTTASNSGHFNPTALQFFNKVLYRGDKDGYLFTHSDSLKTDPYIGATASSTTNTKAIIYDFQSTLEDFGAPDSRKWCTWVLFDLERVGNVDLQPKSRNDEYAEWQDLGPFQYLSSWVWGDLTLLWETPTYYWNSSRGIPSQKRRFPANQVRCTYKQIRFTNDYVLIKDSTDTGTCSTNSTTKVVTLAANAWLSDVTGYFISFSNDDYATSYEITNRTGDTTIVVADGSSTLPNTSGLSWKIYGYPRGEDFKLLEYSIMGVKKANSQQASRPATGADV